MAVIDAPASSLHLASFNAPKILHLWVKPKVQIGKRNNMDIKFSMGVIAFILALNLSTINVFAGKSKYIKEEVSSCGSISGTVKYKGPPKEVRIDLMKEKSAQLVQSIQRLKTE
jgi:hypothetical protein